MDYPDNDYVIKHHPVTQKLIRQIVTSAISLFLFTVLAVGTVFLTTRTSTPVVLGSQSQNP